MDTKLEEHLPREIGSNHLEPGNVDDINFISTIFDRDYEPPHSNGPLLCTQPWSLQSSVTQAEFSKPSSAFQCPVTLPSTAEPRMRLSVRASVSSLTPNDTVSAPCDHMSSQCNASPGMNRASNEDLVKTLNCSHPKLSPLSREDFTDFCRTGTVSGAGQVAEPSSSSRRQTNGQRKKKRRTSNVENAKSSHENDGHLRNTKKNNQGRSGENGEVVLLACPYYKHDPIRHQKCLKHVLKRIRDVKQHLQRQHRQILYCPLCGLVYERKADLDVHLIVRACERKGFSVPDGITEEQEKYLRTRVDSKLSVSCQWNSVWSIIFPNEEPPESPFLEGPMQEGLLCFRRFRQTQGSAIISTYVRSSLKQHGILNEQSSLCALLETAASQALDAVIDNYSSRLAGGQRIGLVLAADNGGNIQTTTSTCSKVETANPKSNRSSIGLGGHMIAGPMDPEVDFQGPLLQRTPIEGEDALQTLLSQNRWSHTILDPGLDYCVDLPLGHDGLSLGTPVDDGI